MPIFECSRCNDMTYSAFSGAAQGARGERLVHPVDGVVVGERQQLDARPGGVLDHLGRRQLAVRVQ